jgi:manganese/zinc/iron transport system permease protein
MLFLLKNILPQRTAIIANMLSLYYNFLITICGTILLSMLSSALGVFIVLRRWSLLVDALVHASLPGVACMFLYCSTKRVDYLLYAGSLSSFCGAMIVLLLWHRTTLKKDTALGIVLSVFFGTGLVLMSCIQKKPIAHQALLQSFLLGKASLMLWEDLVALAGIGVLVIIALCVLWHIFRMISFDINYARSRGCSVMLFDIVLLFLLILVTVAGVQIMGVVLMSMIVIAPAAAARQWTASLLCMMLLALCFGTGAGIGGVVLSTFFLSIPTGPAIVMLAGLIIFISLVCGRGQRIHHVS